jgi:hypothetical protein
MMDSSKKKYLEQNPASRRLLFLDLLLELQGCTDSIDALMRAKKNGVGLRIAMTGPKIAISFGPEPLYSGGGAKELAEFFVCRRLALYGERNEWLECWPDLVDLVDGPDMVIRGDGVSEIASNGSTEP